MNNNKGSKNRDKKARFIRTIVVIAMLIAMPSVRGVWAFSTVANRYCHHHHPLSFSTSSSTFTSRISFHRRQPSLRWQSQSSSAQTNSHDSKDNDETKAGNQFQNANNIRDQVFSALSANGEIKVTVCTIRNLVNDIMIMHSMTQTSADALGRLHACALLMSNGMQDVQTLQITLNGDGPLRGVVAISTGTARVKGYVGSPQVGKMPLQEAIGRRGSVQVVKNHPEWNNPYNGITSIRHGDVDRDVGIYLAESEQKACALAAATTFSNGILCTSAGGYLVEQLPNISEETIATVERNLQRVVTLNQQYKKTETEDNAMIDKEVDELLPTNLLLQGMSPYDIAELLLQDLGPMQPLQEMTPSLHCDCTDDRLIRALRLLPKEDVEEILLEQEQVEARCEFCGQVYRMGPDEVRQRFLERQHTDPAKDEL